MAKPRTTTSASDLGVFRVNRYRWRCPVEGCHAHTTSVGTYYTEETAKTDARAHARAGHRPDGSTKQMPPVIAFPMSVG